MTNPTTDRTDEFTDYLRAIADIRASARKPLWVWASVEELLLGMVGEPVTVETGPLPENVEPGERKQCYINAYRLSSITPTYQYAEGYALPGRGIPVHHAWCVDPASGEIVDPTWTSLNLDGPFLYLGLRFTHRFIARLVAREQQPAVFEADWERKWETLRRGLVLDEHGAVTDWGDPPPF